MVTRKALEIVIVGLWLLIALSLFFVDKVDQQITPDPPIEQFDNDKKIEVNQKLNLKKIIVLSSNSFDLTLKDENNTRILSKLNVIATGEARQKVIDLFNNISNPQVQLLEKQSDGKWIVELFFVLDGQEQNLKSWLESRNLIYK